MDNKNEDFEKYYNIATHQIQQYHQLQQHQQQQQQEQYHHYEQHQNHQNQPIEQQHTIHYQSQIIPPHIDLVNSQHCHVVHDTFDQQAMLNLVPNEFYSSSHFTSNVDLSPNININSQYSQYKSYSDNQSIFLDGIIRSSIPQQADRSKSLSSAPTYTPTSQSFQDNLNIIQVPQRRNSDMLYNHDNNTHNSSIHHASNNYLSSTQQQQEQGLLNESNVVLSSFEHSQISLASSSTHSNFQPKPRQEQDVFGELISMATKNNALGQIWQNHNNPGIIQYTHPSFSSTDIQREIVTTTAATTLTSSRARKKALSTSQSKNNIINYDERIYKLSIAQQPSRARMCGFGDKDRRPISPPPIVQLVVATRSGQVINPETFDTSFLIVMCDSCQQTDPIDGDLNSSMFENPLSQVISYPTTITNNDDETNSNTAIRMRNLVGSSVSSATKLYDLDGKLGIFFVFQDVSLRTEGCFRLKFSLVDVGMPYSHNVNTTSVSQVLKVIYTDPFIVYTAKKFPGVVQSTALSKCFARQGIKIPIRKEKNASLKKNQTSQTSETAEQSEDDDLHY